MSVLQYRANFIVIYEEISVTWHWYHVVCHVVCHVTSILRWGNSIDLQSAYIFNVMTDMSVLLKNFTMDRQAVGDGTRLFVPS